MAESDNSLATEQDKQKELGVFLFLTIVLAPLIAVIAVGGFGLLVWIYQLVAGPPTQ